MTHKKNLIKKIVSVFSFLIAITYFIYKLIKNTDILQGF